MTQEEEGLTVDLGLTEHEGQVSFTRPPTTVRNYEHLLSREIVLEAVA
jgi:hypothetical protein